MSARRPLLTSLAMLILFAVPAVGQHTPEELLQSALYKQQVEGDLEGAAAILRSLVEDFGQHREIAARALVQLGRVHETLGSIQAERAYRRVLSDYPDQLAAVAQARTRLSALAATAQAEGPEEITIRRVWQYPESRYDITGTVSRDGRYITFEDMVTGDLVVRDLVEGKNRYLTHNDVPRAYDLGNALLSPDNRWVAYSWDNNLDGSMSTDFRIVGLDGSAPRVLLPAHEEVATIDPDGWSPDGEHVLVKLFRRDGTTQIAFVSVADGSLRVLKTIAWRGYTRLRLSRDGRTIAYDVAPRDSVHGVSLLAADASRETPLLATPGDDHVMGWTPDGTGLVFRSERGGPTDAAWVMQVTDGRPQGSPELVKRGVGERSPRGMTDNGGFYYTSSATTRDVYVATLDPGSGELLASPTKLRVTQPSVGRNISPDWSPDGKHLVYYGLTEGGGVGVMAIRSLETDEERVLRTRFAKPRNNRAELRWSPDGQSLLRVVWDDGFGIHQVDVTTGTETPLVTPRRQVLLAQVVWAPDGSAIFYNRYDMRIRVGEIVKRDLETGQEVVLHRTMGPEGIGDGLAISPDGSRLAYLHGWAPSNQRPRSLQVIPTSGGEPREVYGVARPQWLRNHVVAWTPDGRYLLFGRDLPPDPQHEMPRTELWRVPVAGGEAQRTGLVIDGAIGELRIHPDGRRIAFTLRQETDELWLMENFLPTRHAGN